MTAKTNQQTLDAVEAVLKGVRVRDAAKQFDVHRSTIWRELHKRRKEADKQTKS